MACQIGFGLVLQESVKRLRVITKRVQRVRAGGKNAIQVYRCLHLLRGIGLSYKVAIEIAPGASYVSLGEIESLFQRVQMPRRLVRSRTRVQRLTCRGAGAVGLLLLSILEPADEGDVEAA